MAYLNTSCQESVNMKQSSQPKLWSIVQGFGGHQSTPLILNSQQNAVSILTSILNKSQTLTEKCDQLTVLFQSSSTNDLIKLFPHILVELFGFSGKNMFGLNELNPSGNCSDYTAVYNFLSIGGCLFTVIDKLVGNASAEFHFPFQLLPPAIRVKITSGHPSLWYEKKLVIIHGSEAVLSCNAVEYYILLFAYYLIHPTTLDQPAGWSRFEDILYIRLLEDYLYHFFPLLSDVSRPYPLSNGSPNLWRSFTNNHDGDGQNVLPTSMKHLTPAQHSESVLQIFCDIWFGLNTEEQFRTEEEDYKLPTIDHARCVRVLVKYMHTFVNCNTEVQNMLFSSSYEKQLSEFKGMVVPMLIYKSLYIYLKHCFTHWPLDSSFRMILETWLSFIQPWRYMDNCNFSVNETIEINMVQWKGFVSDHFAFYTTIFRKFLDRALRFDFTSLHDVKLVYRVSKVFAHPSLDEVLRACHVMSQSSSKIALQNKGSMCVGTPFTAEKKIQFESFKDTTTLFDSEIRNLVYKLCQKLVSTVVDVRLDTFQTRQGKNVLSLMKKFFYLNEGTGFDDCEKEQLLEALQKSCENFSSLFDFSEFTDMLSNQDVFENSQGTANIAENNLPEFTITEQGVELTEIGRYQILHGIRRFPITYSGDPEFQPLRSYESFFAVKYLHQLACKLNLRYSNVLYRIYNQPSWNYILQKISKNLNSNHYLNTSIILPATLTKTDKVTPRISLRFAASYYFMGSTCWLMVLAKLFGFSWILGTFLLFAFLSFSVIAHIDSPPKKFKDN